MENFEDDYRKLEAKIEVLESQLDDALLAKFNLELQQKSDSLLRYEMQEMIRNIYHECKSLSVTEERQYEEKPDLETILKNLSENIRIFAKGYNINL